MSSCWCGLVGQCSVGDYECAVGSGCVTAVQLCDGVQHCADGSDEDWRADCALSAAARM